MSARPMRILSIDGGGMKGVYACSYLATIADHFKIKLHEHFDMIAGTSTGGIIALGIGAKFSATELLTFYKENGPKIFPKGLARFLSQPKRFWSGHAYNNKALRRALEDTFGTRKMTDSAVMLCIPSIYVSNSEPRVFKATKGAEESSVLKRDTDLLMSEVALATSAAPWYLPMAKVNERSTGISYIDGGLWANNPSIVAIAEAKKYYCGQDRRYDGIQLLSIALPAGKGYRNVLNYPIPCLRPFSFTDLLLSYAMESHKIGAHHSARFILSTQPDVYFRNTPENLSDSQKKILKLDSSTVESIELLTALGQMDAENDKQNEILNSIF